MSNGEVKRPVRTDQPLGIITLLPTSTFRGSLLDILRFN
jgi:hypothetical protein